MKKYKLQMDEQLCVQHLADQPSLTRGGDPCDLHWGFSIFILLERDF